VARAVPEIAQGGDDAFAAPGAQIDRFLRSTIRQFYDALFESVNTRLPPATKAVIEALVKSGWGCSDVSEPASTDPQLRFDDIKAPPGRISVDSMAREVAKLERIRSLGLSSELFERIPARSTVLSNRLHS